VRLLAAAALALLPASVGSGTIHVGQGAAGVTVGMTRAAVVAKLGKPVYQNANGYMQYAKSSGDDLFDVYLNTATKRVRLIGISGKHFCTAAGICMFRNGGIAKLKAQYGKALKYLATEDGSKVYQVNGRFGGKKVFTAFTPGLHGQIIQVFIGYL
jgi:hypothetical protein